MMKEDHEAASTDRPNGKSHSHAFSPASPQSSTTVKLAAEALHEQALACKIDRNFPLGEKCQASSSSGKLSTLALCQVANSKLQLAIAKSTLAVRGTTSTCRELEIMKIASLLQDLLEALQQLDGDHQGAFNAFLDKVREMLLAQAAARWPCHLVPEVDLLRCSRFCRIGF